MFLSISVVISFFAIHCSASVNGGFWQQLMTPVNPRIDPCDDFYEYACANWNRMNFNFQNASEGLDVFAIVKRKLSVMLLENLTSNITLPPVDPHAHLRQYAKQFYLSCLATQEEQGVSTLKETFERIANVSISHVARNADELDWLKVTAALRLYDVKAMINEAVGTDWRNSSKAVVYILAPKFDIVNKEDLRGQSRSSEETLFFYERYIKMLMLKLGFRIRIAREVASAIIMFEKNLAELISDDEVSPPEPINVATLKTSIPEIDWDTYLRIVLVDAASSRNLEIIVDQDYYRKLQSLIARTNRKTIAEYLLFKFMSKFRIAAEETHSPDYCLQKTTEEVTGIGQLYIRESFDNENRQKAAEVVTNIKTSFLETLRRSNWLDEKTKQVALTKLQSMTTIVGFGDQISSADWRGTLNCTSNYYNNLLILANEKVKIEHAQLQFGLKSWIPNPMDTNAFYKITKNAMFIPAALLLPPIFDSQNPSFHHYAVLGAIVGHEMTHGFDFEGKNYDSQGSLQNWWTTKSLIHYYSHVECLLTQYKNVSNARVSKPPRFGSISENLADLNGIQLAFNAYSNWKRKNFDSYDGNKTGEDELRANMSDDQLFFLSFAQFWCTSSCIVESGTHSTNKYRVFNSLSNFRAFSTAYNCSGGSFMNPSYRCGFF